MGDKTKVVTRGRGRPRTRNLSSYLESINSSLDPSKLTSSSRLMRNLAEKQRRDKLNHLVQQIANTVPIISRSNKRVDKTSILRLAASYIRFHRLMKDARTKSVSSWLGPELAPGFLQATGGFLLIVSSSERPRRSFSVRLKEKPLSRNDPPTFQVVHIVGSYKSLPDSGIPVRPLRDDCSEDYEDLSDDDEEFCHHMEKDTHMLVGLVRVVRQKSITDISRVEALRDEYITRHSFDGSILYTDHRIAFVTGLMPGEVLFKSAFTYMHEQDMLWSLLATKQMLSSSSHSGEVTYRLQCKDGTYVTLHSQGYVEYGANMAEHTFVCINTVVRTDNVNEELADQRRKFLPLIDSSEKCTKLASVSDETLPPVLVELIRKKIDSTVWRLLYDPYGSNNSPSDLSSEGSCPQQSFEDNFTDSSSQLMVLQPDSCGELSPYSNYKSDSSSDVCAEPKKKRAAIEVHTYSDLKRNRPSLAEEDMSSVSSASPITNLIPDMALSPLYDSSLSPYRDPGYQNWSGGMPRSVSVAPCEAHFYPQPSEGLSSPSLGQTTTPSYIQPQSDEYSYQTDTSVSSSSQFGYLYQREGTDSFCQPSQLPFAAYRPDQPALLAHDSFGSPKIPTQEHLEANLEARGNYCQPYTSAECKAPVSVQQFTFSSVTVCGDGMETSGSADPVHRLS